MKIVRTVRFEKEKVETARNLVKTFFDVTDELKLTYPDEVKKLSDSPDVIREVFRHSVCTALDLQSVSYVEDFKPLYPIYANRMKPSLERVMSMSVEYKQGILQAGIHFIVRITKKSKKELEENYAKY